MNVNDLKSSKFLTKHNVEPPVLVTIKACEEMDVSMESQAAELKWTLTFNELEKPMVLNSTNGQLIAAIAGSGESEDWIGRKIVLYNDKTVSFGGQITGGIRVRAPKTHQTKEDAAAEAIAEPENYEPPAQEGDQDIPF